MNYKEELDAKQWEKVSESWKTIVYQRNKQIKELEAQLKQKGKYGYSQYVVDALTKERDDYKKRIAELEEIETDLNNTIGFMESGITEWKEKAEGLEDDLLKANDICVAKTRKLMATIKTLRGGNSALCKTIIELQAQLAAYQWKEDDIVKDLHNIMSLVAKDKYLWNDLGYYGDGFTAEEIIGFMLKALAENGSKIACTGKIKDMRPIPPLPERKKIDSIKPVSFLHDCKRKVPTDKGIMCKQSLSVHFGKHCSKRCVSPEPEREKK